MDGIVSQLMPPFVLPIRFADAMIARYTVRKDIRRIAINLVSRVDVSRATGLARDPILR